MAETVNETQSASRQGRALLGFWVALMAHCPEWRPSEPPTVLANGVLRVRMRKPDGDGLQVDLDPRLDRLDALPNPEQWREWGRVMFEQVRQQHPAAFRVRFVPPPVRDLEGWVDDQREWGRDLPQFPRIW